MWPFTHRKQKPMKRAYAGAMVGRLTADWITSSLTQDSEIRSSLTLLRNRSRELFRDNDYMRGFARLLENNVIGHAGIPFQAQVRMQRGGRLDEATNDAIERAWEKWCRKDSCHTSGKLDLTEIAQLLVKTAASDGEYIVRIVTQSMGRSKVPMALELIETDRLDENLVAIAPNGNQIRMGVEVNAWGRPVAYHFLPSSPGDIVASSIVARAGRHVRVPAEEIVHSYIFDRVGQTRGVPWIASVMMRLRHMGGYEEAEVIGARIAASQMGFIESPEGEAPADGIDGGDRVFDAEPGQWRHLGPGEKASAPPIGRPSSQFDAFVRAMLRGAAVGVGAAYRSLSGDSSQSNYSSSRLDLLDERDHWKKLQCWMIRNFYQTIYDRWLDLAVLSGEIKLRDYETKPEQYQAVKWCPRGWSWVDPAKEVSAYKDAVRNGFKTQTEIVAESGGDIEEMMTQRERELKLAKEKGLVFDTDPFQINGSGGKQGSGEASPPRTSPPDVEE